jgi:hypothetical protein
MASPPVLTDYGKPLALITSIEREAVGQAKRVSDPSAFRRSLLVVPHALEVDF